MTFTMKYDKRNRDNLDKLADNTKVKAYQWYQYCIDHEIPVLIYETIRTREQQRLNVQAGKSKTMSSWHLTGQALDWVIVDEKGNTLWNAYKTKQGLQAIEYAESLGFTSGHRWGWDSPHLQYDKIAYGKDTFGKLNVTIPTPTVAEAKPDVSAKIGYDIVADAKAHRIQSGKYPTLEAMENSMKKAKQDGYIGYAEADKANSETNGYRWVSGNYKEDKEKAVEQATKMLQDGYLNYATIKGTTS